MDVNVAINVGETVIVGFDVGVVVLIYEGLNVGKNEIVGWKEIVGKLLGLHVG